MAEPRMVDIYDPAAPDAPREIDSRNFDPRKGYTRWEDRPGAAPPKTKTRPKPKKAKPPTDAEFNPDELLPTG